MKTPGRNHPAGRDLPMRGHIGCGASTRSHDDASSSAKVEYRTSSTPAYTDELDLLHSTNNAPTTTRDRFRLRLADNHRCTHHWCAPTNSAPGPHSALRTTPDAPMIGAHPRTIDRGHTPHCGQLRLHQQWVPTHEPRSWRSRKSSRRRFPTWANSDRKRPARQRLRKPPPRNSALRTTTTGPIIGPRTRMLSPALPAPVPHEPASDRSIAPTEFSTPGNRGVRAPRGSSWIAPRARLSCGRALAWTTGPGGSTSGPR